MQSEKELLSIPIQINCLKHTSQLVQRIDPNLSVKKHLYCFECILESDDPKSLYSTLPSLSDYISSISTPYGPTSESEADTEIPKEYLDVLCEQDQILEKYAKYISQEKERILVFFNEIKKALVDIIETMKTNYFQSLDDQLVKLKHQYSFFEKELKKAYNKSCGVDLQFPSTRHLKKRVNAVQNASHFHDLIDEIKQDLAQIELSLANQGEEKKKWYFDNLIKNLKKYQKTQPIFEGKDSNVHAIKDEMSVFLHRLVEVILDLKNPILEFDLTPGLQTSQSYIIEPQSFLMIKDWLPPNQNFNPKLLYRGSRDGMSPQDFHLKCDGKGPTITLIKCYYGKQNQEAVIGGFIDQSWHKDKNGSYIFSNKSFIFSLTSQQKFPIRHPFYAAYGFSEYGPTFGGHDICITKDLTKCFSRPYAYTNSSKLLSMEGYIKDGCFYFTTKDIEVYTLK